MVVREEKLIWREVNCAWSSFCFDSYVELSDLSWEIIDWREAFSSSDADGVAGVAWGGFDCCWHEKEAHL